MKLVPLSWVSGTSGNSKLLLCEASKAYVVSDISNGARIGKERNNNLRYNERKGKGSVNRQQRKEKINNG